MALSPIAGDHFHLRMQTEPARKTICGSFRKQVNHLAPLTIGTSVSIPRDTELRFVDKESKGI
jgi:hypothetical protein